MFRNRVKSLLLIMMMLVSLFSILSITSEYVSGVDPIAVSYSITPEDPSFEDTINVSITYDLNDETIDFVDILVCPGESCLPQARMADSGDGMTFYYDIPSGGFGSTDDEVFTTIHFFATHSNGMYIFPDPTSEEINFTIVRRATGIEMTASPDVTTVFPNETITISGKIIDDLGSDVPDAYVNLTIPDTTIVNSTMTNETGHFDISTSIPTDGTYTINLTADKDGMMDYDQWEITVNSWPLPQLAVEGEIIFEDSDRPVGETGMRFYEGSEISLTYRVSNIGNGIASNVTALINISGEESLLVEIGNMTPSPTQRYEDSVSFNTSSPDIIEVNITIDWDQIAPPELKIPYAPYEESIEIIAIPTWENHTVLVEMFTQSTCVPCVDVEEALERLLEEGELDFELITYVYDDQASKLRGDELGVTSTPDVFIDHRYDRMSGGGTLEELTEHLEEMILDASGRDTPPLSIEFMEAEEGLTVSLALSDIYEEQIAGIFQVYSIETHSNVRNQQGIPIANRYHGAVDGMDISNMNPGSVKNLTAPHPERGFGYIAVAFAPDGKVLQSASFIPDDDPRELYMVETSELIKSTSPAQAFANLSIEMFQFEDEAFLPMTYTLSVEGLPENWTLDLGTTSLSDVETELTFSYDAVKKTVKDSTRVMYFEDVSLDLGIPEDADGSYSFKVVMNSSGYIYKATFIVMATPEDDPNVELTPEITDIYLEGAGQKIYFYIEAENVPEGANVKGRILPCNYGEGAACGIPSEFLLIKQDDGRYRASITGVDLTTFTHLSYSGWIEKDGVDLNVSQERKVEIETLIDIEDIDDDTDEDTGNGLFIFILVAILVIVIVAAVLFIMFKRKQAEEEAMEGSDQGSLEDNVEEDGIPPVAGEEPVKEGPMGENSENVTGEGSDAPVEEQSGEPPEKEE